MSGKILLLQQADSLLYEEKYRNIMERALAKSSLLPNEVKIFTVDGANRGTTYRVFPSNSDLPNYTIWELDVTYVRYPRDFLQNFPTDFSAVFVPILDPMSRSGYPLDKDHSIMMADGQDLQLRGTLDSIQKSISAPIIIICIKDAVNGLDTYDLVDDDLLEKFNLVEFHVDDELSFIGNIQSVLGIKDNRSTD